MEKAVPLFIMILVFTLCVKIFNKMCKQNERLNFLFLTRISNFSLISSHSLISLFAQRVEQKREEWERERERENDEKK
jgi:hypothetical protein